MRSKPIAHRILCCILLCLFGIGLISCDTEKYSGRSGIPPGVIPPQRASIGSLEWNYTWSGPKEEEFADVAVDENGNVYACGKTSSWSKGQNDSLLVKYSVAGTRLWNTTLGGVNNDEAKRISLDSQGRICITGEILSWGHGFHDALIAQYNSTFTGNPTPNWNETYGGALSESGTGIATDRNNSMYISGMYHDGVRYNALLAKYDPYSHLNWNLNWNLTNIDLGQDLAMDWQNNFYIAGIFYNNSNVDVSLGKFNANLHSVWNQTWGWIGYDQAYAIAIDDWGNVYVTGETNGTGKGNYDIFLLKYDSAGNRLWNTTWGGTSYDSGNAIATDRLGNIFVAGETASYGNGGSDVAILKYNGTGGLVWNKTFGGIGMEKGRGIAVDGYGDYILVAGYTTSWGAQGRDALILKINDQQPNISNVKHKTLTVGQVSDPIQWTITDPTTNLTRYVVYRDGVKLQDQSWVTGENVVVDIGSPAIGTYNYTLIAWDGAGDVITATVLVTVTPLDVIWITFLGLIGSILIIYFLNRSQVRKVWKRKMLSLFVGFAVVSLSVVGWFSPVFFFNSGGRYDDDQLNSLGVPFTSPGDIYFYATFFGDTTSNPQARIHTGIDYALKNNSLVRAVAPGQVMEIIRRENERETVNVNRYHVSVTIRYSQTIFIRYNFEPWSPFIEAQDLQLSLLRIEVGDWVLKGEVIGTFLKAGESAHIHFGVSVGFPIPSDKCPTAYMGEGDLTSLTDLAHSFQPTWDICYCANPSESYNSQHLDYMVAPFENVADNRDFREGYSSSASCPWGFVHTGVDFFLKNDTKVISATPGQVVELKVEDNGVGAFIRYYIRLYIQFNSTIRSHYSFELKTEDYANITRQLDMILVKVGDWVTAGQELARFFNCGGDPDHIDCGVLENYDRICPQRFFSPAGYAKMMDLVHAFHPTWDLCYS